MKFLRYFRQFYITNSPQIPKISETRDIKGAQTRDIKSSFSSSKSDISAAHPSLSAVTSEEESGIANIPRCPYCSGKDVVKRGKRKKKYETAQPYFCHHCRRTFTGQKVSGEFDNTTNYRFTASAAGYYLITAMAGFSFGTDGKRITVSLYKNGADHVAMASVTIGSTDDTHLPVAKLLYLNENDYIELYVRHNKESDATLYGVADRTYMTAHKLP